MKKYIYVQVVIDSNNVFYKSIFSKFKVSLLSEIYKGIKYIFCFNWLLPVHTFLLIGKFNSRGININWIGAIFEKLY